MQFQDNANEAIKIPHLYIKDSINFFAFCKKIKPLTKHKGLSLKPLLLL